jgi:hypothetical protein
MSTEETDMTIQTAHNVAGRDIHTTEGGVRFKGKMSGGNIAGRDQHFYGLTADEVANLMISLKQADQPSRPPLRTVFRPLIADRTALFGGRAAVLQKIQAFAETGSGYLMITAPAGFGKTSLGYGAQASESLRSH